MIYHSGLDIIGDTPCIKIDIPYLDKVNVFAKLEFYNPTGSVKDRAASQLLSKLLRTGVINEDTAIIESSSGNFGIALAAYCKKLGLRFICVVDKNILQVNEQIIKSYGATIIKVTEKDETGGYLLNRIKKVKELQASIDNSYWVNQYGNMEVANAYYDTLADELLKQIENMDYLFIGVSSCGTITGVSRKFKEVNPKIKIIAVDVVGSVIFGNNPKSRFIPGIGSSMQPEILGQAKIDEYIMIDEADTIKSCWELVSKHLVFAGGSSGTVYTAIRKYFTAQKPDKEVNIACIFADSGERYISTIYNEEWVKEKFNINLRELRDQDER